MTPQDARDVMRSNTTVIAALLVREGAADAMLALRPPGAALAVRTAARKAKDPEERAQLEGVAARLDGSELPVPAPDR